MVGATPGTQVLPSLPPHGCEKNLRKLELKCDTLSFSVALMPKKIHCARPQHREPHLLGIWNPGMKGVMRVGGNQDGQRTSTKPLSFSGPLALRVQSRVWCGTMFPFQAQSSTLPLQGAISTMG